MNENKHVKEISGQVSQLQKRSEDGAADGGTCACGMREMPVGNIKAEVLKLFALLAPGEKEKMGFLSTRCIEMLLR